VPARPNRLDPSQLISDDRHRELSRRLRRPATAGLSNVATRAIGDPGRDLVLHQRHETRRSPRTCPSRCEGPNAIDFEFDGARQLAATRQVTSKTGASLRLQSPPTGHVGDVASSRLTVTEPGQYRKSLGSAAAVRYCLPPRSGLPNYRLWTTPKAASRG